jgi:seryl-tRNA synthetase
MHDLRVLREQPERVRDALRRRGALDQYGHHLDRAEQLEAERRAAIQEVEARQQRRNAISADVARRKKAGEPTDDLMIEGRQVADEIGLLDARRSEVDAEMQRVMLELPNVTLPDVPEGGEDANTVVRSWGTPRDTVGVRPHWEIGAQHGLLDLERATKISGSGFAVLRGDGARLVRALMGFMLDTHTRDHEYEELWVPKVVLRDCMVGTAQLPKFEDDMYAVKDSELFLITTAEVPVTNLYRDEILEAAALPSAFCAYTPCFRQEKFSAGKDTRGILRMHEFDKVELVRYATPETSVEEHERLTAHAEALLQQLGLPYRVLLLASGDTGFASAKTYDLEVWAPGVGKWLEVSSCSNFLDFQARRANIRYRPAPGEKPRFVHTLNGSALAFPRIIAALLEHHQQPDGTVQLPDVLQPYMGRSTLG